jgi:hypothetical protein
MLDRIKEKVKTTALCYPYIYMKSLLVSPKAQNDEEMIINRLLRRYSIPKVFIEFGFSGWEFNCVALATTWRGLLVDGDLYNVRIAQTIFKNNITPKQLWLTLDSLVEIEDWLGSEPLGILSVDVDGNDYWFLQRLILKRPALFIAEYNSSFGFRPVTVPYDPEFDRTKKHETWTYFGCSLTAINHLANLHGYSLIEVCNSGVNAFFVRNDFLVPDDVIMKPKSAFREKVFADGSRPSDQWEKIKHLPFVDVTK